MGGPRFLSWYKGEHLPAGTSVVASKTGGKMKCVGALLLIAMLSTAMAAPVGNKLSGVFPSGMSVVQL